MANNLQRYHKTVELLCQWLPGERITRVRNLALLLVGLQQARGIHLSQIVNCWPSVVGKVPSLVNRLRRFLSNEHVEVRRWYEPLARHLLNQCQGRPLHLIIDCTKVGLHYRMLSISLAYKKRALPLVWSLHRGRRGHVGHEAQLTLLTYLTTLIAADCEVWLMGDAGFESVQLLQWLTEHNWHFVLRQPGKNQVRWPGQPWIKLGDIAIQAGETHTIGLVELTAKHASGPYWLTIHWATGEDEPWFLLSSCTDHRTLLRLYAIRMWTEELYGDLKGHGFDSKLLISMMPTASLALCLPSASISSGSSPLAPGWSNAVGAISLTTSRAATRATFGLVLTGLIVVLGWIPLSLCALPFIFKLICG